MNTIAALMLNRRTLTLHFLIVAVLASGCLKTRAQLEGDAPAAANSPLAKEQNATPNSRPVRSNEIDEIKMEITRLTGKLEVLEKNLREKQSSEDSNSNQSEAELSKRLEALEKTQLEILSRLAQKQEAIAAAGTDYFESGKTAYKKKQYEDAVDLLSKYLSKKNADNIADATYLRAESYYKLKKYQKAILDYSKFAENKFGKTPMVPEALYKIGLSFENLGLKDDAKAFYQDLVNRYPKSARTKAAKKKLN